MGKKGYLVLMGVVLIFGSGLAQIDPGTPDTVRVGSATATAYGQQIMLSVFGYNSEDIAGASVPLKYNGNALLPDSVSYVGGRLASAPVKPVTIDTTGQTVFFGAIFFGPPVTPGSGLLAKVFFTVKSGIAPDTIDVDTFFNPPAVLTFVEPNANEFVPQFVPGKIFVNVPPLPVPHNPVIIVPGTQQVFGGFNISFSVTATDVDTGDVLTITKSGPPGSTFSHVPKKSPASGLFSWTTTAADTLGSPYLAIFIVNDGTGRADTGEVSIDVLPFTTPPTGQDGDVNGDGVINGEDIIYLVNYIFHEGPPPNPLAAGDINGDCFITVADIIYLANYYLKGGTPPEPFCLPGDVNHDGFVNLPDIIYFINYLLKSGTAPVSLKSSDVNADCHLDLADIVFLVNFLFKGGPLPEPGCVVSVQRAAAAKPPAAEMGFTASKSGPGIVEINVDLNLVKPAAAVMLKVEYDPSKLRGLQPGLTSRSQGMELHYNDKGYVQTIGLLDLTGNNLIGSGTGSVVTLRFQLLDPTDLEGAIRITYSEVVAPDASNFEVHLAKGLQLSPELAK